MKKIYFLLIMLFFAGCFTTIHAQKTITSAGGNATGTGGTSNYTLGQLVYQTYPGTNGSSSLGVQQPYEISVITETDKAKNITLFMSAYPNPANESLTLKIENFSGQDLSFSLLDNQGRLLQSKKVTDSETIISMTTLSPSVYFLKVLEHNKEIKTFKIIKN